MRRLVLFLSTILTFNCYSANKCKVTLKIDKDNLSSWATEYFSQGLINYDGYGIIKRKGFFKRFIEFNHVKKLFPEATQDELNTFDPSTLVKVKLKYISKNNKFFGCRLQEAKIGDLKMRRSFTRDGIAKAVRLGPMSLLFPFGIAIDIALLPTVYYPIWGEFALGTGPLIITGATFQHMEEIARRTPSFTIPFDIIREDACDKNILEENMFVAEVDCRSRAAKRQIRRSRRTPRNNGGRGPRNNGGRGPRVGDLDS